MAEPVCGVGDGAAQAAALERRIRDATAHLAPGIDRAGVGIAVAVRLLASAPQLVRQHLDDPRLRGVGAIDAATLDAFALLLQQLIDEHPRTPVPPLPAARGVVATVVRLTLAELDRPEGCDLASVIAASTVMLRGIIAMPTPAP